MKSGIGWTRTDGDGRKIEVNARQNGPEWIFTTHRGRSEYWQPLAEPLEEDWQELADAVDRRVQRGLMKPAALSAVQAELRRRFPRRKPPAGA